MHVLINTMLRVIAILFLIFFITGSLRAQNKSESDLASFYMQKGEYDKAIVLYEKLYNKTPTNNIYQEYLKCLFILDDFDKAEKLIKKQIKKFPENSKLFVDLGYVYKSLNQPERSVQQYDKSIKLLPARQEEVIELANAFIAKNELDYAIATYIKGQRLLKDYYSFHFELAEVYFLKQDFPRMLEEYLDVLLESDIYIQSIQNVLQDKFASDPADKRNELLKILLLKRIQKYPDKYIFSELLLWHLVQQKDFESAFIQAKALDKRLKEDGSRLITLAKVSASNENYDVSIKSYQYVIDKGVYSPYYLTARIELLNTINKKLTKSNSFTESELANLEKDYLATLAELGKNTNTAPLIRGLAHLQAFYLNKVDEAIKFLEEAISFPMLKPQIKAECKLELGDVYLIKGEVWEATLLYSQVDKEFKHDPLGQEAKYRNAKLSYYRGDFKWAQAQLDILKSATSQLIANDALALSLLISDNMGLDSSIEALALYAKADLLSFQNKNNVAFEMLDSIIIKFPTHVILDEVLYKKAEIKKKQGQNEEAAGLLEKIIINYSFDILADDALFNLAELNEKKFKNSGKAMELYQELLTKYPGSSYVVEARKRYRILRGDVIN